MEDSKKNPLYFWFAGVASSIGKNEKKEKI